MSPKEVVLTEEARNSFLVGCIRKHVPLGARSSASGSSPAAFIRNIAGQNLRDEALIPVAMSMDIRDSVNSLKVFEEAASIRLPANCRKGMPCVAFSGSNKAVRPVMLVGLCLQAGFLKETAVVASSLKKEAGRL